MQGIDQSWIWILAAVALVAFFVLRRGGRTYDSFGSNNHGHGGPEGLGATGHGGFGHGGFGHGGHGPDDPDAEDRSHLAATRLEAVIDPVSGSAVPIAGAITSVYQGKAYYFASKENRDRFEAAPQDFADKVQGVPVGGSESADRPRHRRHGC